MVASSERVSRQMSKLGQRDTVPEIAIRSELHRRGLRFRVHAKPEPDLRTKADIIFRPKKVCVYIDGCFWHSCAEHGTMPASNRDFWEKKLRRNVKRDVETTRHLTEIGWTVLRYWEHEEPSVVAEEIDGYSQRKLALFNFRPLGRTLVWWTRLLQSRDVASRFGASAQSLVWLPLGV